MGEMSMVNPVTCLFFLHKALNDAFEVLFFLEASFLHFIKDTDSTDNFYLILSHLTRFVSE